MIHRRTYSMPAGYNAEFRYRDGILEIDWTPDFPDSIRKPKIRRRLWRAYEAARADFLGDLAAMSGHRIGLLDTLDGGLTIIEPGTRQ
ncbi:hypothetical protein [Sinorhizobium meliloti]|uniref:hypothetical protein n=1 Tax=Rhizobium meliloti TaxID=382 RepID=UPI000FE00D8E|nr:hypothetical protein [Sinorhizobium meliloti]MDX0530319.1 hypothetical protein [Sinorhizobium medicae]MDX0183239.1 hypothetical protein [Sinorhizobium meliloti]MDX0719657.1 hypothetical protein [Sinorhizobium medicae]MDX0911069.1 hypothetical protein [Sinorhizobium medicae]RVL47899.1 hypothetical protein CN141_33195 [Sinorhizobium meliloti]